MPDDEVRKALTEDAAEDVRAESDARNQPKAEPVIPLIHSSEQTSDAVNFWMDKFRARRASRTDRTADS